MTLKCWQPYFGSARLVTSNMSDLNENKIIIEADERRLGRFQILNILLGLLLAAALIVPGFIFRDMAPVLLLLGPFGIVVLAFWFWTVPSVFIMRNPVKRIEIFTDEGKVRINEDIYDLNSKVVYFEQDSGILRCLPFSCTRLKVTDAEKKTIKTYYTGSGTNKYACEIRNNIKKNLLIFDENHKQISSEEKIDDEYLDGFGVVRIEFPAANIRNEFYKEGSLILGIGVFAYAFSFLPESVFMEAQSLYSILGFMRNLSYLVIAMGLILSLVFYYCYRKLARKIEIRENSIKINDEYYLKEDILWISTINSNKNPENTGEGEAWLMVGSRKTRQRFYLGQARNPKCFEPRRKLQNALDYFFNSKYD